VELTFAQMVRKAREQLGLTQTEVANLIGVDYSYVSKIEREVIPPPTRPKVLAWLDVLKITDPAERLDYLLAAGCLSYDDVEQAAQAVDLANRPEAQEVHTILASLKEARDKRQEAPDSVLREILDDSVGSEIADQLVSLVDLLSDPTIDENTKKGVWNNLLNAGINMLNSLSRRGG